MINIEKNEMNYLLGYPIDMTTTSLTIRQIKLKEFMEIDYDDYSMTASLVALPKTFLMKVVNPDTDKKKLELSAELESKSSLEVIRNLCLILPDMPKKIVEFLNLHMGVEVIFDENVSEFAFVTEGDFIVMTEEIFEEAQAIFQDINQLSNTKDSKKEYESDDPFLVKIQKLADEAKAMADKNKSDGDVQTFASILSTVATLSPLINLITIQELTLYQIYEQYQKMIVKDSYDIAMMFAPHTGEVSNVEHWSKTIHKKEEQT